jgi:ATP-dependent helicase/nuclease subunit B
MTRALKAEGAPTVPSRWLLRLDTVLQAVGLAALPPDPRDTASFRQYQALLDSPAAIAPTPPPAPCPPVPLRPRRLSVTEIETWMRDPYAIYARHVLRLDPLEPIDADPGAAERGSFIHTALDDFVRGHPGTLPPDALEQLEEAGRRAFGEALARPGVWAFWWPRFQRIAAWFLALESERRQRISDSLTEQRGLLTFDAPGGRFELRAKADRIDLLHAGGIALIDYKTGAIPKKMALELGFAPQLPLEAAIAEAGGFGGVAAAPVVELGFWHLSGGDPAGEICPIEDPGTRAEAARIGLARLVAAFDDPATPYLARPRPAWAPRYSDYAHLARIAEWGGEIE